VLNQIWKTLFPIWDTRNLSNLDIEGGSWLLDQVKEPPADGRPISPYQKEFMRIPSYQKLTGHPISFVWEVSNIKIPSNATRNFPPTKKIPTVQLPHLDKNLVSFIKCMIINM
jgi:hypothetical protein